MNFTENEIYHVYNRSVNHELLFKEHSDYCFFLKKFEEYVLPEVALISYSLMPTHFHLLIQPMAPNEVTLKAMTRFLISFSKSMNGKYKRHGSLLQNRTKSRVIEFDDYLSSVINYIHQNPVAAKLCSQPGDWKFSSYNAIVGNGPTRVAREDVIEWFGGIDRFIEYHAVNRDNHWVDPFHFGTRTS